MSRNFPDRVRPEKVAAAKRTFAGQMGLLAMPRLAEVLASPEPSDEVSFEIDFGVDGHGQLIADVAIKGQVPLICQRSLERFYMAVASQSRLGLVRTIEEAGQLPDDYEPMLMDEEDVALAQLVEEELLLSVPLVPVKPGTEPVGDEPTDEMTQAPTHRPFGVLAELKNK